MGIILTVRMRHSNVPGLGDEVTRARLLFARKLMVSYGVPYGQLWTLTGFSSRKDMERHWNAMF